MPRAQGEALWRRFKTAHDEVWARCEAHFAAEAERAPENLAEEDRAVRARRSARRLDQLDSDRRRDQALQAEWKTIGPVSRGQEKAVWERFRAACDRFFTRRHDDLAQRKTPWAENLAKKEALCAQAEALADSTDWDAAAAEIRRLQGEWKTIGPVKKSRSEAIWQRFRGACDRFFARYAQRHEIARERARRGARGDLRGARRLRARTAIARRPPMRRRRVAGCRRQPMRARRLRSRRRT